MRRVPRTWAGASPRAPATASHTSANANSVIASPDGAAGWRPLSPHHRPLGSIGPRRQVRIGGEDVGELLLRLLALGRQVLGGPQAGVRAVVLEHVAGDGDLVHL